METFTSAIELIRGKLISWVEKAVLLLPNFIISLIVVSIAYFLALMAGKGIRNILDRFIRNTSLVRLIANLTRICVLLMGVMVALQVLQLDRAVTSLLTGVGILGLVIGFAFQDMAANFFSGVALVFKDDRPFKVGDIVETKDHMGIIREINLRESILETFTGQWVFVPNRQLFQEPVVNFSMLGKRRIDLGVGVSYGDDLNKVKEVTIQAIQSLPHVKTDSIQLYYEEFGDSSINFVIQFWIPFKSQSDYRSAKSHAIMAIKSAYDQNNITIPFPIRTLDFGIKGGITLQEILKQNDKRN